MARSVRGQHPAQRGLVVMSAWVDPALRQYARALAQRAGVGVSEWIGEAVRQRCAADSARAALALADARAKEERDGK